MARSLAIASSLATLWWIGIWSDLIPFLYISDRFPIGALPCWNDFLAVTLNVVWLTGVFLLLGRLYPRLPPRAAAMAEGVFLASFVVPANVVRNHFHLPFETALASAPRSSLLALAAFVLVVSAVVIARWRGAIVASTLTALAIMCPLVAITFAQAGWAISQARGPMQCSGTGHLATALPGLPRVRVLWVMFDELEEHAAFEARPAGLALPALDRFRAEAFTATSALPPGDRTERSMPGVLSGRVITDSRLAGPNQLLVEAAGVEGSVRWSGADTVFGDARRLGVNTGVAGFFLPYCALIGDVLTTCTWQPCVTCGRMVGAFGETVRESMKNQLSELVPRYSRRRHLAAYRALREAGLRLAVDPSIGLALVHLPVPHAPPIYDAASGTFSFDRPEGPGYYDNLALADRTFAELRQAAESSGTWPHTAVIVFGDHGRRNVSDDSRIAHPTVPLLVKLPGRQVPHLYTSPVSLAILRALSIDILAGHVTTSDEVAAWLDARQPPVR